MVSLGLPCCVFRAGLNPPFLMHVKDVAVSILKYSRQCKYPRSTLKTQGENEDIGNIPFQPEDHTLMPVLEARFSLHQSP